MRTVRLMLAAWVWAWTAAGAAGVWETKPFTQWSDKELEKVLTDSPWAGKAALTHARAGAGLGSVPDWKIVVALRSALPMKQAFVRSDIGVNGTPTAQHQQMLAAEEGLYVVSISGLPRSLGPQLQKVADAARLTPRGKEGIGATQGSMIMIDKDGRPIARVAPGAPQRMLVVPVAQRGGGRGGGGGGAIGGGFAAPEDKSGITATLILGFPKDHPIVADDQEFEFSTVLGAYNLKKTFKLKDMMFMGALAL
jgi:hypothetical protein